MRAIEYEGEEPKPNNDLGYEGKELRGNPGNREKVEYLIGDTTSDKWTNQKERIGAEIGAS